MALVHSQSVRPHGFVIFVIVCIDFCESGALSLVQHRPVKLIKFLISVRCNVIPAYEQTRIDFGWRRRLHRCAGCV